MLKSYDKPLTYHCWHVQSWFSSEQPEEQAEEIACDRTVGVAPLDVKHAQQLGEEDDIDEVAAQEEQGVDGGDRDGHNTGHDGNHQLRATHHPHHQRVRRLQANHKDK